MPNEFFPLPANLIAGKKVFTLKVSGESMINVGIYDGDILIVERKNTAVNGETVVAMNENNEVTVKTFYKEKIISDCNQKMIPWLQLFWIRLLS